MRQWLPFYPLGDLAMTITPDLPLHKRKIRNEPPQNQNRCACCEQSEYILDSQLCFLSFFLFSEQHKNSSHAQT
jgi:hypothetical protein